ncbi:MAG: DEAD/DEAH box helicase [Bacilli bacterium]|nr:DEAD/DEAH box helicase [Bacilli bacterium]
MIEVNDYVFHKNNFGLGIVREISNGFYNVEFINHGLKKIYKSITGNEEFLIKLDKSMVSYILNENNYSNDKYLLKKGRDYFNRKKVLKVNYGENSVISTVRGSWDYEVVIEFENNRIKNFDCSCPVKGPCKHLLATLLEANYQLKKLIRNETFVQLGVDMKELEEINFSYDYTSFLDYYKAYLDFKENYKDDLHKYLYGLELYAKDNEEILEFALSIPLLYQRTKRDTHFYCEKVTNSSALKNVYRRLCDRIKNELNSYRYWYAKNTDLTYKQFIVKEDFENLLIEMNTEYFDKLITFIVKSDILEKYDLFDMIPGLFYKFPITDEILELLKDNLTIEQFNKIIDNIDLRNLSINSLEKIFSKEQLLEVIMKNYNKNNIEYLCANYSDFIKINKKKTIQALVSNYMFYPKLLLKKVMKTIEADSSKYLQLYLNNKTELFIDEESIDVKLLMEHFDFKYDFIETKEDLIVEKKLYIGNNNVIWLHEEVFNGKYETGLFPPFNINKINDMLDEGIILTYGTEYTNLLEQKKQQTKIKRQKLFDNMFKKDISKFTNMLVSEPIVLSQDRLMDVEFNFDKKSKNYYTLSFRVGKEKKYIVKNINNFVDNVLHGKFAEYGKGLAFSHIIDNFNPIYHKPLLLALSYASYNCNGKEMNLSDNEFLRLLLELKGLKIKFNDIEYLVRLDKQEYKIEIDSEYKIHDNYKGALLLYLYDKCFYLNYQERVIDVLAESWNDVGLINFMNPYNDTSIKNNLQVFKDEVYERFSHIIKIDEKVKDKFKIKDIKIKAHFDYNNKKITVKNELYDDENNLVFENNIKEKDYLKYNKYLNYLSNLGFIDNELVDSNKILNFLSMDFTELKKLCSVYLSDSIMNKKIEAFDKHTIIINNNSTIMEAFVEESKYSDEELYEILKALKLKKKFVLLKGDRIVRLDNEEAEEFFESVNTLKLDKKNVLKPKQIPIYQSINAYASLNNCKLDEYLTKMINEIANFKNYEVDLPVLNATLREYQIEGFKWLSILTKYHLGGILADDMGLGKTIQMIALIKANKVNKPSLIICPKTLIFNWKNEFQKFDTDADVVEIYGSANVRERIINNIDYKTNTIYLTSYDSLRNDLELYNGEFNFLILDEAQVIKNVHASKSMAVKNIKAINRFALTGTPIENNIIDLWSIFDFIMPEYFEELSTFKSLYNNNSEFVDKVSKRIAPFILRRTKKSVLKDLPNKYEQIITVPMKDEQQKIYDAYRLEANNILSNGGKSFDVLAHLTKLRQICIDPSLFVDNYHQTSAKMEELDKIVTEYIKDGHRILIFSQFVKALDIVKNMLDSKKIKHFYLTGDTKAVDRIKYTNEFNADEDIKVFLISLKAGGTGLNLIGADTVIHLDPWWNQAVEEQATDRTYRIGQTRNVEVIKLICEDSIEKRVIELQNLKKDLIDKLISNDDSNITKLTLDDLKFILKD